ncbi:hypothetical protein ACFP2T_27720 [Plantactinospora solaniradicis]|uniref:PD-(D/E)XK endonuclease-like domain-containing protein n=1 Tax=Plantactinospora solaniradicis TaxID=1723736 RepID=A0ABW1KDW6_9ACTN
MSALVDEVKDPGSPVAMWLRGTFPHHKDVQLAYRISAGPARVLPSPAVASGTQGAAIDWWLRMLVDRAVSVDLALTGLMSRRVSCVRAGLELLFELGGIDREGRIQPVDSTRLSDRPDEWWARLCYALALWVELHRAASVEGSRLTRLGPDSRAADLLALANDDEVADLIAMRDLAIRHLLPALPPGPVCSGAAFDGSRDLHADSDLIAGGVLVDFKAGRGGKPRADGSRAAGLARAELDQLLGYAMMAYSDTFALHTVAIYAVRFGHYAAWPITDLCAQLAGRPVDFPTLRQEFARVLQVELPAYWAEPRQKRQSVAG